jgi:hypothetical protein
MRDSARLAKNSDRGKIRQFVANCDAWKNPKQRELKAVMASRLKIANGGAPQMKVARQSLTWAPSRARALKLFFQLLKKRKDPSFDQF